MNYKFEYFPEFGLAGIEDTVSGIKVYTLVMEPGEKKAAIMAYVGARLSRSAESILTIFKEVFSKFGGVGASKRIEKIVQGYGHASVADMSHNMVFVERVPMVGAMRYFYLNAKQDGQERSTRFQDFSAPEFYPCVEVTKNDRYYEILHKQIKAYNTLLDETSTTLEKFYKVDVNNESQKSALTARTFDTLRHLLPMGMRTNFCGIMSSRDWARYIGLMRGSSQSFEQVLGQMLFDLLVGTSELKEMGYVPESDSLIKYADANSTSEDTTSKLKEILAMHQGDQFGRKLVSFMSNGAYTVKPVHTLVEHISLLLDDQTYILSDEDNELNTGVCRLILEKMGESIFGSHNDRKQLGPIFQQGAIGIRGKLDIGALKDFNRQRSLERFIPYLDNQIDPDTIIKNGFSLCDYLSEPGLETLRDKYRQHFQSLYSEIRKHHEQETFVVEDLRYILPHAHRTPYRMYGSMDDMMYVQNLRLRPGGHINYRMEAKRWCDWMVRSSIPGMSQFWKNLQSQLPTPDPSSREQFLDRS